MSKQIEEVMGLVEEHMEDANGGILSTAQYVKLDSIRAKLRELLPVWQPIESAPKFKRILVCQKQNDLIAIAHGIDGLGNWRTGPSPMDYIVGVTHWMELPEPPKDEI